MLQGENQFKKQSYSNENKSFYGFDCLPFSNLAAGEEAWSNDSALH